MLREYVREVDDDESKRAMTGLMRRC